MIPEFFYLPEFLVNSQKLPLGVRESGEKVDDVILPTWAKSPSDFIYLNRCALESDYVSITINNWIDLIFGYKQSGKAAEEAGNVFHFLTYSESIAKIDLVNSNLNKEVINSQIANFGQTPPQIFREPHISFLNNEIFY